MNVKIIFASMFLFALSCKQEMVVIQPKQTNSQNPVGNTDFIAPTNFKWQFLQDYIITLNSDTLLDNVSFSLYSDDANLVYEGLFSFGYSNFSIKIPRDVKYLTIISNNPKIVPGQTIDLYKPTGSYNGKLVIKTNVQGDKLWIKKSNESILKNANNKLFKAGDISNLWDINEFVYTRTLFEDLWPSTADYDFNDMVVDNLNTFELRLATNRPADTKRPLGLGNKVITKLFGTYIVQANGAGFNNGLAVQLFGDYHDANGVITPINNLSSYISNVTFSNSSKKQNQGAKLETLPNGEVVIIIFAKINDVKGSIFQNTDSKTAFGLGDTIRFTVELTSKVDDDYWNGKLCNFRYSNPFLLQNGDRTIEIHVAGERPTMMANTSLFGTGEDNTNIGAGRTYVSKKNNLPWALTVPSNFVWATEKVDLMRAYPNFIGWVKRNGINLNEWRYNKVDSLIKYVD